jgi:monoamine oxidase
MGEQNRIFDAVIVGAGLAGLTAACCLKDFDILVLEKEASPGGRVLTRRQKGISYDLGAVFPYPAHLLPLSFKASPLLDPPGPIGIFWNGEVHLGARVSNCLKSVARDTSDMDRVRAFHRDPDRDARDLPPRLYAVLNALFQVIHPGEIEEYLPERQLDAFITHPGRHHEAGNSELIEAFTSHLKGRLLPSASVLSVSEKGNRVAVHYQNGCDEKTVFGRTALITTPAPVTLRLLKPMPETSRRYLSALDYPEGTVVALGFEGVPFPDFSYIVTPALAMNTVLQQKTPDERARVLLVYYAGRKSVSLKGQSPPAIVEKTLASLRPLGFHGAIRKNLLFSDVHHWPCVGPVITSECRKQWHESASRPVPRVFLGGEHMCWDPSNPLPYGMAPAVMSGKQAAGSIGRFLLQEPFRDRFLVRKSRYLLTEKGPLFRGSCAEGNVALYGLVLQAETDEALRDYLLDSRQDHLWEWETGFGVTAEDSALVLEGLMESNVDTAVLTASLDRLKRRFFSSHHGAFKTVLQGRARYWQGPSVDATAQVGYLMHRVAPGRFEREVKRCVRFVLAGQHRDGYWQGKWFPSRLITTRYAARLCAQFPGTCAAALEKAEAYVLGTQKPNGCWNDSVIDTANAMLLLREAGNRSDACSCGAKWLLKRREHPGWAGEPVLYYWFDLPGGMRVFYHCIDTGAVTRAWALLALKEVT